MSGFEFVLVLYAIVVGLGISSILADWGEQIRARHQKALYPLQIALSVVLLLYGMTYLWTIWNFRDVPWTFPLYILVAVPALILSLAASIIRIDTSVDSPATRVQYFQNSGPAFLVLALVPLVAIAMSLVATLRGSVPDPPNLVLITLFRLVLCAGMASLAWIKSERLHWIGVGMILLVLLGLSARISVRLIAAAA